MKKAGVKINFVEDTATINGESKKELLSAKL